MSNKSFLRNNRHWTINYSEVDEFKFGKRLVLPFAGIGHAFLNTNYNKYLFADSNADLINVFKILAAYQEEFIENCRSYFTTCNNSKAVYDQYAVQFNKIDLCAVSHEERILKACLLIYLNCHGAKNYLSYDPYGDFNVPYGNIKNVYFPECELLAFISKINKTELVEFKVADFERTFQLVESGDVIYCELPEIIANQEYRINENFALELQCELEKLCTKITSEKKAIAILALPNKLSKYFPKNMNLKLELKNIQRKILGSRNLVFNDEVIVNLA